MFYKTRKSALCQQSLFHTDSNLAEVQCTISIIVKKYLLAQSQAKVLLSVRISGLGSNVSGKLETGLCVILALFCDFRGFENLSVTFDYNFIIILRVKSIINQLQLKFNYVRVAGMPFGICDAPSELLLFNSL